MTFLIFIEQFLILMISSRLISIINTLIIIFLFLIILIFNFILHYYRLSTYYHLRLLLVSFINFRPKGVFYFILLINFVFYKYFILFCLFYPIFMYFLLDFLFFYLPNELQFILFFVNC